MIYFNTCSRRASLMAMALGMAGVAMADTSPTSGAAEQPQRFVAGLAPYERPQGAPVLLVAPAAAVRAEESLHGISEPIPASIKNFLDDQGAWHTPFSWPGATPPYDLRGWHVENGR